MTQLRTLRSLLCACLLMACGRDSAPTREARAATPTAADSAAGTAAENAWLTPERRAAEDTLFHDAAAAAWAFADRNYLPRTGLICPFDGYAIATMWDIASGLAAMYSAEELGLLPRAEYDKRMSLALHTLETIPL